MYADPPLNMIPLYINRKHHLEGKRISFNTCPLLLISLISTLLIDRVEHKCSVLQQFFFLNHCELPSTSPTQILSTDFNNVT